MNLGKLEKISLINSLMEVRCMYDYSIFCNESKRFL
jgi:hypothetical protein